MANETYIESMRNHYFTRIENGCEARDAEVNLVYLSIMNDKKHKDSIGKWISGGKS